MPSHAAIATHASGITKSLEPFGEPTAYGSLATRANMMSTPRCCSPPRGVPQPLDTTGARPCQRGTGQIQRPGRGPSIDREVDDVGDVVPLAITVGGATVASVCRSPVAVAFDGGEEAGPPCGAGSV